MRLPSYHWRVDPSNQPTLLPDLSDARDTAEVDTAAYSSDTISGVNSLAPATLMKPTAGGRALERIVS